MVGELQAGDPERVGPYRLLGRLGAGGMGQVFLGRSAGGRLVAVKVIRTELAGEPGFRARFAREVAAARKVSGLFTALVVDADVAGPLPWLATAYVAGPSLAEAVDGQGPLPVASVLTLAAGLAEGLEGIHAAGVVHRDLKPSNVLLADDGPRVIDFGISRAAEASVLTQFGTVMGTAGFMSPEQAEGGEVGPPSDVFSLGAVLTFAATGEGPFGTGSAPALVYRVVHSQPDIGHLPAEIRPLVERCLNNDPSQRPTTADLLAELGAAELAADWLPAPLAAALGRYAPPGPAVTAGSAAPTRAVTEDLASASRPHPANIGGPPTETAAKLPRAPEESDDHQPGGRGPFNRRAALWALGVLVLLAVVGGVAYAALGRGGHAVPQVKGMSLTRAEKAIKNAGLSSTVHEQPSSVVAKGTVIGTNPPSGTVVAAGTKVALNVSSGPQKTVPNVSPGGSMLPNVVNEDVNLAEEHLANAGFSNTTIVYLADPSLPNGIVTNQDPPAGQVALPLTQITLSVVKNQPAPSPPPTSAPSPPPTSPSSPPPTSPSSPPPTSPSSPPPTSPSSPPPTSTSQTPGVP